MIDNILQTTDDVLFLYLALSCLYLFVFAYKTLAKHTDRYPKAKKKHCYAILIPENSSCCEQEYPKDLYSIIPYNNLSQIIQELDDTLYEAVIILEQQSRVSANLLKEINEIYDAGIKAIQLHHVIADRSTRKLRRQALYEEIDQSIFKEGHVRFGLTSALDKVNMAVDLKWLKKNLKTPKSNLERKLIKQHVYTEYLEYVHVESNNAVPHFRQVSRKKAISELLEVIQSHNWDYTDKLLQRFMPSWKIQLLLITTLTILIPFYDWTIAIKWWILLFCILLSLSMAIPDYLVENKKKSKKEKKKQS